MSKNLTREGRRGRMQARKALALEEISTQNGPPNKNNKIIVKIIK